ncbi:hypothetical protein PENFLA_c001G01497 [Penicillium flavigenum]|uniref:Uncharacterized protein n=1 Tax=Penicillium flavigenum TaxID=254877 RepID=A0A1V6U2F2_9EURO|nr:hypothetical protein PENFLA_c001G01497 [Penicillium flavigenum]
MTNFMRFTARAVFMMGSLCGTSEVGFFFVAPIARFYNLTIIAAIAYGDETYISGMPWNMGNCKLGYRSRQFSGVRSKPLAFSQKFTRSTQVPHRLYSNPPRSSPPRAPSAPQSSRSNFPIIPIILITVISSGAYVYLVKSRTGVPTSRQN